MCKCHGIGTVKICTDMGNSADVKTLVVHERPLLWPTAGLLVGWLGFMAYQLLKVI